MVIRSDSRSWLIATTLTARTLTTFHGAAATIGNRRTEVALETDRREEVEPGNIDTNDDQGHLSAHRQGGTDHRGQPRHRPIHRRGLRPPWSQGGDHRTQT